MLSRSSDAVASSVPGLRAGLIYFPRTLSGRQILARDLLDQERKARGGPSMHVVFAPETVPLVSAWTWSLLIIVGAAIVGAALWNIWPGSQS